MRKLGDRTKDKKHLGLEADILLSLNRPSTAFRVLQKVLDLNKYKTITYPTIYRYLLKLESQNKVQKIQVQNEKNKLTIWQKC